MPGRPEEAIYRFLDTNGDGSGTKNANGDYSSVADEFYFQYSRDCEIHRMIIQLTDTSGITQEEYGNLAAALSNGYTIKVQDDSQNDVVDLCDGVAITKNEDFGRYCYDVSLRSWATSPANESIQARWTFSKAGHPLYLPANYRVSITFNDNLSGLLEHYFMVNGYETTV